MWIKRSLSKWILALAMCLGALVTISLQSSAGSSYGRRLDKTRHWSIGEEPGGESAHQNRLISESPLPRYPKAGHGFDANAIQAALRVDGSTTYQTIDGFGVNANPKNWYGGQLVPALDMLVDDLNATIWRVDIFGKSNWEAANDNDDPFTFNWAYYNGIYTSPPFQDLWATLHYLNQKNVRILLSASGIVPAWMGGTVIRPDMEDEWVEEIVSAVYYARNVEQVSFDMLDPLNETDMGAPEGPYVEPAQFQRLISKLVARLRAVGMGDLRLVVPSTADIVDYRYLDLLFGDSAIMAQVDCLGFHNYDGFTDDMQTYVASSPYPNTSIWMTEYGSLATDLNEWQDARDVTDHLLSHLGDGVSAGLDWDAYDNVHDHMEQMTYWGKLRWNQTDGTYSPRKKYYTDALLYRNVIPGSVRIGLTADSTSLIALAFYNASGAKISIVGHNPTARPIIITGALLNLPVPSQLRFYQTNAFVNLRRGADVQVARDGTFTVQVDPDTFFALTTQDEPRPRS